MDIIKEVELFILQFFEEHIPAKYVYHSVEHTKMVVKMASEIADSETLDERNKSIVKVAAWFHDTGYSKKYKNHEEVSCKIAREFLASKNVDEGFITEVENCIRATKMGYVPQTLNEKVIADADLSHAGLDNFLDISNLLRKETSNISDKKQTKLEHWKKTLDFLEQVKYQTNNAKENFEDNRKQNIEKVKGRINKLELRSEGTNKKQPIRSTQRGTETMFRLTARNQINLSSIADNKANIMLTINSVLLSILISTSILNIQRGWNILIPGIILVVGCLISLIFSIMSVRPKISTGRFTDEDLEIKNVNLLFFGNFYDMPYSKYEKAVKTMIDDYDFLYGNLIKDQHSLGKVLFRKYKLLSFSYDFFMFGFVCAVLTYFVFYLLGS